MTKCSWSREGMRSRRYTTQEVTPYRHPTDRVARRLTVTEGHRVLHGLDWDTVVRQRATTARDSSEGVERTF